MKFLTLKPTILNGHETVTLLNPDGSENLGYSLYRDGLLKKRRGLSINTIKTYLKAVAEFLDYLHAYVLATNKELLNEDLISEAIDCWDDYLVEGEASDDFEILEVCKIRPSPRVSPNTSSLLHSSLKSFLRASSKLNRAYKSLDQNELIRGSPIISNNELIELPKPSSMPLKQRAALISNSIFAGVIKGGANFATPGMFPNIQAGKDQRPYKDFPYDKIHDLLKELNNDRDRALYAFIAASGCRIHEALRILTSDIDPSERRVQLVDPKSRINDGHYDSFNTAQRKTISIWKGRQTEATFLIEPFKSLFFKYAESYFRNEKPQDVDHEFFFCCIDKNNWGKPFLFARPTSIREGFNKAKCKVLGQAMPRLGPHSLRHTYGYFLKNFCPRIDGGYGLDLPLVQTLMGHSEPASTKRYAKYDSTLVELEIAYANALVYDLTESKSVNAIRKDILLNELQQVNAALKLETNSTRREIGVPDV